MAMAQLPWMGDQMNLQKYYLFSYIKLEIANTSKLNNAIGKNLIVSTADFFLWNKHD